MSDPAVSSRKRSVGVWIRVSTENQAAGDSPETHEHRARGFAAAKDWGVVEIYHLSAVSGKHVRDHPECRRMLEDVRSGRIEALIFSKLARLARNTRDLLDFADYFRNHDADLVSLQENIDTGSHSGRLFYTVIAALAQWEREEISSRVKEAVATRAKMGKPLGGQAPYGYRWNESKQLELLPEEASVRALMYELFLKHRRVLTVARDLNERGMRTRRGKEWSNKSVRHILTNPVSKGLRRTNHSFMDSVTGQPRTKPESEWVYISAPRIVSDELWDQVNAILDRNAERFAKRPGRKSKHLFTGLVHCGCGNKMYVGSKSHSYSCKACSTSIPTADLEAIFLEKLRSWLTPETIAAVLLQGDQIVEERRELLQSLTSQLRGVEGELDHLFSLHRQGEIPTEGFGTRYQPLEARQKQLSVAAARTQGELDGLKSQLLDESQALEMAKSLLGNLEALDEDAKRQTIESLVDRVTVRKEEVTLRLNYLPFLLEGPPTSGTTERGRATA